VEKGNLDQINALKMRITQGEHELARIASAATKPGDANAPPQATVPTMAALLRVDPTLGEYDQRVRDAQIALI
jgi:hypothetical protein